MVTVDFDDESYKALITILQEKFYATTDLEELEKINKIFKKLHFESGTWLSELSN